MRRPYPAEPPRTLADGRRDGADDHRLGLPRSAGNATDTAYWRGWREGWDESAQRQDDATIDRFRDDGP